MTTLPTAPSPLGSTWRRWDLHIHTPASYHWNGPRLQAQTPEEQTATWRGIVDRLNSVEIDAFCIMDYWTFDGFLGLREYIKQNPAATLKRVFPGIELRLEAPTDFRLNTHVLFDDDLSEEKLSHFLARLSIGGTKGPPPSRETFMEIARQYDAGKLRLHGFQPEDKSNDDKMLLLGMQTAVVTRESLLSAVEMIGKEKCLIIQPYDTSDGLEELDWKRHPYSDSYLMKMAHIFETRDPVHVSLFLGFGHPKKKALGAEFIDNIGGLPKPVVSGSDAHRVQDYGVYPSDRVTWLKAQPTFSGLRQVCNEPALRCFIGQSPPKRDHIAQNSTKYITHLTVTKRQGSTLAEHWFDRLSLPLNPGLIAIIGNKGSGKSAIADIIALAGNTHCAEMEFLNEGRFRRGENKSKHFDATLTWGDGTPSVVSLADNPRLEMPERLRYLPQQFIENLCNEIASGDETNFERELRKVIFSHVPEDRRLHKASLDELLNYTADKHRNAVGQLQVRLHALNGVIVSTEREMSDETLKSYSTSLSLKQAELDAHEKAAPEAVPAPGVSDDEKTTAAVAAVDKSQEALRELNSKMEVLRTERTTRIDRQAVLERLLGHVSNFEQLHRTFVEDNEAEFSSAGFPLAEVVKVTVTRTAIEAELAAVRDRLTNIAGVVNGTESHKGLNAQIADSEQELLRLQGALAAPQKKYQDFRAEQERWQARKTEIVGSAEKPDTIEYLKARIQRATNELPPQLAALKTDRTRLVREIHTELLKIRAVYQELYEPMEQVASNSAFVKESLELNFSAFLSPARFEDNFLEFIHRNRVGTFHGDDESHKAVRTILIKHDFNDTDSVVAFVDEVMNALTGVDRNGAREPLTVQSQLKANKSLSELYDFLFGLKYLEHRYTLRLGDKDIGQLSPGEKGALLLVFYLLLDREQIPIIIDQPEQNLDNESVVRLLVDCVRQATARRQVIIVTHNPNLAVVCDADQIVHVEIDKTDGNRISLTAGAIEDYPINKATVDILEGTHLAFDNRKKKYHKPLPESVRASPIPVTGSE